MRRDRRRAAQFWSARKRNNQSNNNNNTSHDQNTSFQSCNSGNPIISIMQDPPPSSASTQQSNHLPSSLNVSHPSYFHQSKEESQQEEVNTSASTSFHSAATTSAIDPSVYKHMELLAVVPLHNNEQDNKKKKSKPHIKMRQRFSSSSNNNNHSHNIRNRLLSRHRILLDNHSNLNINNTGDPGPIDETKQDDTEEPPSLAKKNIAEQQQQQQQDESIQLFSPPRLPKHCSVDDNVLLDHNYLQSLEKRVQKERLMQLQVDCSHDQKEQENDNEKETSDLFPLELFNPSDDQDKENNEFLATAAPPRLCKQPRQQPPSGSPIPGRQLQQDEEQDLISEILEPKLPPSPLLDKKNKTKSILKQVRFAPPDSLEHIEWLEQTAAQERLLALQQMADKNKKKQQKQWDYYDNNGDTFRNFWKDLQRGPKSQCGTLLLQRQCHPRDFGLEEGRHDDDDEYDYEDETTDHSRSTHSRRPSTLWGALADEFTALVDTLVREYEHTNDDDKEKDLLNTSWDATTITTEASSVSSCSSSSKPPQLAAANEILEE